MVYRVYVEKKKELANEAKALLADVKGLLQLDGIDEVSRIDIE